MRAILKRTEVENDNSFSVRIELFGLTIYERITDDRRTRSKRQRIGFTQYPSYAPTKIEDDDDYFTDEVI